MNTIDQISPGTQNPSAIQTSLPYEMQLFSFWASIALTILSLIIIYLTISQNSRIFFRITNSILIRILPQGEGILCDINLISHHANSLVLKIYASLTKTSKPTKSYKLELFSHGERRKDDPNQPSYGPSSSSSFIIIPPDTPMNLGCLLIIPEYKKHHYDTNIYFRSEILRIKNQFNLTQNSQQVDNTAREEINNLVSTTTNSIIDKIQLEEGDYHIKLTMEYESGFKLIPYSFRKECSSSLDFSIEEGFKMFMRNVTRDYLQNLALSIIANQPEPNTLPTYFVPQATEL